jgi:CRP-like cAMP-binding protein
MHMHLHQGKVAVCADKENLGTLIVLKPGAFFGESSLVTGNPRNATVGCPFLPYFLSSLVCH